MDYQLSWIMFDASHRGFGLVMACEVLHKEFLEDLPVVTEQLTSKKRDPGHREMTDDMTKFHAISGSNSKPFLRYTVLQRCQVLAEFMHAQDHRKPEPK